MAWSSTSCRCFRSLLMYTLSIDCSHISSTSEGKRLVLFPLCCASSSARMSEPDSRNRFFQRYTLTWPGGWSGLFVLRHTFEMACLRSVIVFVFRAASTYRRRSFAVSDISM